jgi:hypothetical protein
MKPEIEPMQQVVRKVVGRPPTASQRLAQLEELTVFLKKHAHESLARAEGDYFPIRKTVGRLRSHRGGFCRRKTLVDLPAMAGLS